MRPGGSTAGIRIRSVSVAIILAKAIWSHSALYQEFTEALTEVLAESSVGPARRGRLARARAAVKKHPKYSEHEYFLAVETAFTRWELLQNTGR
jgi:hypothetical protein